MHNPWWKGLLQNERVFKIKAGPRELDSLLILDVEMLLNLNSSDFFSESFQDITNTWC